MKDVNEAEETAKDRVQILIIDMSSKFNHLTDSKSTKWMEKKKKKQKTTRPCINQDGSPFVTDVINIDTSGILALEELHNMLVSLGLNVSLLWSLLSIHKFHGFFNIFRTFWLHLLYVCTVGNGEPKVASHPQAEASQICRENWNRVDFSQCFWSCRCLPCF